VRLCRRDDRRGGGADNYPGRQAAGLEIAVYYRIDHALCGGEGWPAGGDCGRGSGSRLAATGELERPYARLPSAGACGSVILLGVPEGAVVRRVYRHVAIVSPPAVTAGIKVRWRTSSGDN